MNDNAKQLKIKEILKKLSDSSADIRQQGLKEATYCADISVLEAVKKLLNDVNPAVRYYAKKAFGSVSAQISTRAMIEAEEQKAREALEGYDEVKSSTDVKQDFIPAEVREKIKSIQSIADSSDDLQAGFLISELNSCEDKYIIATLIKKLGRVGSKSHEIYLIPFLSHADTRVIANAVEALDEIGSEEGISEMLKLLSHEDNRIKGNITRALYKYLEKDTVSKSLILDKLKNMLNSKEPWTQDSAVFALSSIANQQALDILESYSLSTDSSIKSKIDSAVIELKRKLVPNFNESEKKARETAEKTIKGIDGAVAEGKSAGVKVVLKEAEGFFDGLKERIWPAGGDGFKNSIRLTAAVIGSVIVLFTVLVFFNVLYLLMFSSVPSETVRKSALNESGSTLKRSTDIYITIKGLAEAAKYDSAIEALSELKSGGVYDSQQIELIELVYSKKVRGLIGNEKYKEALETISGWQSQNSSSVLACVLKGQIELKHFNRSAEAKAAFSIAASLQNDCTEALLGMADCYYYEGDFQAALVEYDKALTLCCKTPEFEYYACFGIANSKASLGDYNSSVDYYKKSLQLNPDHYISYIGLCKALRRLKKYKEALETARILIEIDPALPRANFEYAESLDAAGDVNQALKYYKTALELEPENLNCRLAYVEILFKLQIYQGLDEIIKPALKGNLSSKQAAALYEKLGMAEYNLHYSENARRTFEKYIGTFGESDMARYYLALIHEEKSEYDMAIENYQKAISANNKHLPSYLNLSNIYLNVKKDYNRLDTIAEVGITNCGNDPGLLYNKALGKYFDNRPAEALLLLRAVINSNDAFISSMARNLDADIRRRLAPRKKNAEPESRGKSGK